RARSEPRGVLAEPAGGVGGPQGVVSGRDAVKEALELTAAIGDRGAETAEEVLALEEGHAMAELPETKCGGEAGDAASDHRDRCGFAMRLVHALHLHGRAATARRANVRCHS